MQGREEVRALGDDGADVLETVVGGEGRVGNETGAVNWRGGVGGCAGAMAWAIVGHEVGAGLGPAVSSLISVHHLSGVIA